MVERKKPDFSILGAVALLLVIVLWGVGLILAETVNRQNQALAAARGDNLAAPIAEIVGFVKWCAFFLAICATAAVKYLLEKRLRL